jgi:hypothetical protein
MVVGILSDEAVATGEPPGWLKVYRARASWDGGCSLLDSIENRARIWTNIGWRSEAFSNCECGTRREGIIIRLGWQRSRQADTGKASLGSEQLAFVLHGEMSESFFVLAGLLGQCLLGIGHPHVRCVIEVELVEGLDHRSWNPDRDHLPLTIR